MERLFLVCSFSYTDFYGVLTSTYSINQAANSVDSDLPAFWTVQTTSLWRVLYHRRETQKQVSERPLLDILEVLPRFITERKAQVDIIAE